MVKLYSKRSIDKKNKMVKNRYERDVGVNIMWAELEETAAKRN